MPQALASAKKKTRRSAAKRPAAGEALRLEQVAADQVSGFNAFYRRRAPAEITIAGRTVAISVVWPAPNPADQRLGTIDFTIGETIGKLRLPLSTIEQGLTGADSTVDLKRLQPAHAALLLESAFEEELEWLEGELGDRIAITSIERKDTVSDDDPFAFALTGKDDTIDCALSMDSGLALRMGRLLDRIGKESSPIPPEFPLPVCLWRNALTIDLGELQSLQPGDVVLFEEDEGSAAFVIADRFFAPVALTPSGPQLLAAPTAIAGSKWEWTMNKNTPPPAGQALEESNLEELPVALVFELGRTAMPLGEVRQLAPGAIVPLAEVTSETVDIIANGKRVGRGEIVRIGESLGVRIARMFDNA